MNTEEAYIQRVKNRSSSTTARESVLGCFEISGEFGHFIWIISPPKEAKGFDDSPGNHFMRMLRNIDGRYVWESWQVSQKLGLEDVFDCNSRDHMRALSEARVIDGRETKWKAIR